MKVTTGSGAAVSASAEVNYKSGGEDGTFYLEPPKPSPNGDITEVGATYLTKSVSMSPEQAAVGASFPMLKVSGTFWKQTPAGANPVMPSIFSGQINILAPLEYSQIIPPAYPIRK
jgi:hypothetical protein